MTNDHRIVTVTEDNLEEEGFFCFKSKPKSEGFQKKQAWLRNRFEEGMKIKIIYEGEKSCGFIEYIPGEFAWRVLDAPNYLVIHCLWVVGRWKGKGYGSLLLEECLEDARAQGKSGLAVVSSSGTWLADKKVFLKNGFQEIETAPPSFTLLVHKIKEDDLPNPSFPRDWEERIQAFGSGATVMYADQCPYMPDAVSQAVKVLEDRGFDTKTVKFESRAEIQEKSPTPYGIFGIVIDSRLLTYTYIGKKELRRLEEEFLPAKS
ncbi:MAG: GNAT family N-acetyltransferase [Anaerolineales bacterium]|jgi:ribosomal protein S18 acetylase RimI-like enzyme